MCRCISGTGGAGLSANRGGAVAPRRPSDSSLTVSFVFSTCSWTINEQSRRRRKSFASSAEKIKDCFVLFFSTHFCYACQLCAEKIFLFFLLMCFPQKKKKILHQLRCPQVPSEVILILCVKQSGNVQTTRGASQHWMKTQTWLWKFS